MIVYHFAYFFIDWREGEKLLAWLEGWYIHGLEAIPASKKVVVC
jgi:hypothetical protein